MIAGIHLSEIPPLDYQDHLFYERSITTVTANTRQDGRELLHLAADAGVTARTTIYPFLDAQSALDDLAGGSLTGTAVLQM